MSIYQLYSEQNAATAAVTFDVRANGTLELLHIEARGAVADGKIGSAWLSWLNSDVFSNHDQLGNIGGISWIDELTTSGAFQSRNSLVLPLNIKVEAGERLYFWVAASAGVVTARAWLHINDGMDGPATARRRR